MTPEELAHYNRSQVRTMLHDFENTAWLSSARFMRFWVARKAKGFRRTYLIDKKQGGGVCKVQEMIDRSFTYNNPQAWFQVTSQTPSTRRVMMGT